MGLDFLPSTPDETGSIQAFTADKEVKQPTPKKKSKGHPKQYQRNQIDDAMERSGAKYFDVIGFPLAQAIENDTRLPEASRKYIVENLAEIEKDPDPKSKVRRYAQLASFISGKEVTRVEGGKRKTLAPKDDTAVSEKFGGEVASKQLRRALMKQALAAEKKKMPQAKNTFDFVMPEKFGGHANAPTLGVPRDAQLWGQAGQTSMGGAEVVQGANWLLDKYTGGFNPDAVLDPTIRPENGWETAINVAGSIAPMMAESVPFMKAGKVIGTLGLKAASRLNPLVKALAEAPEKLAAAKRFALPGEAVAPGLELAGNAATGLGIAYQGGLPIAAQVYLDTLYAPRIAGQLAPVLDANGQVVVDPATGEPAMQKMSMATPPTEEEKANAWHHAQTMALVGGIGSPLASQLGKYMLPQALFGQASKEGLGGVANAAHTRLAPWTLTSQLEAAQAAGKLGGEMGAFSFMPAALEQREVAPEDIMGAGAFIGAGRAMHYKPRPQLSAASEYMGRPWGTGVQRNIEGFGNLYENFTGTRELPQLIDSETGLQPSKADTKGLLSGATVDVGPRTKQQEIAFEQGRRAEALGSDRGYIAGTESGLPFGRTETGAVKGKVDESGRAVMDPKTGKQVVESGLPLPAEVLPSVTDIIEEHQADSQEKGKKSRKPRKTAAVRTPGVEVVEGFNFNPFEQPIESISEPAKPKATVEELQARALELIADTNMPIEAKQAELENIGKQLQEIKSELTATEKPSGKEADVLSGLTADQYRARMSEVQRGPEPKKPESEPREGEDEIYDDYMGVPDTLSDYRHPSSPDEPWSKAAEAHYDETVRRRRDPDYWEGIKEDAEFYVEQMGAEGAVKFFENAVGKAKGKAYSEDPTQLSMAAKHRDMARYIHENFGAAQEAGGGGSAPLPPGPQENSQPGYWSDGAIQQRIQGRKGETRLNSGIDPDHWLDVGVLKIRQGVKNFREWALQMLREFGQKIRPQLDPLWERARGLAEQTTRDIGREIETTNRDLQRSGQTAEEVSGIRQSIIGEQMRGENRETPNQKWTREQEALPYEEAKNIIFDAIDNPGKRPYFEVQDAIDLVRKRDPRGKHQGTLYDMIRYLERDTGNTRWTKEEVDADNRASDPNRKFSWEDPNSPRYEEPTSEESWPGQNRLKELDKRMDEIQRLDPEAKDPKLTEEYEALRQEFERLVEGTDSFERPESRDSEDQFYDFQQELRDKKKSGDEFSSPKDELDYYRMLDEGVGLPSGKKESFDDYSYQDKVKRMSDEEIQRRREELHNEYDLFSHDTPEEIMREFDMLSDEQYRRFEEGDTNKPEWADYGAEAKDDTPDVMSGELEFPSPSTTERQYEGMLRKLSDADLIDMLEIWEQNPDHLTKYNPKDLIDKELLRRELTLDEKAAADYKNYADRVSEDPPLPDQQNNVNPYYAELKQMNTKELRFWIEQAKGMPPSDRKTMILDAIKRIMGERTKSQWLRPEAEPNQKSNADRLLDSQAEGPLKKLTQKPGQKPAESFNQWLDQADVIASKKLREAANSLNANPIRADLIPHLAVKMAKMIRDGIKTTKEVTQRLIQEYGPQVRPYLRKAWEKAQEISREIGAYFKGIGDDEFYGIHKDAKRGIQGIGFREARKLLREQGYTDYEINQGLNNIYRLNPSTRDTIAITDLHKEFPQPIVNQKAYAEGVPFTPKATDVYERFDPKQLLPEEGRGPEDIIGEAISNSWPEKRDRLNRLYNDATYLGAGPAGLQPILEKLGLSLIEGIKKKAQDIPKRYAELVNEKDILPTSQGISLPPEVENAVRETEGKNKVNPYLQDSFLVKAATPAAQGAAILRKGVHRVQGAISYGLAETVNAVIGQGKLQGGTDPVRGTDLLGTQMSKHLYAAARVLGEQIPVWRENFIKNYGMPSTYVDAIEKHKALEVLDGEIVGSRLARYFSKKYPTIKDQQDLYTLFTTPGLGQTNDPVVEYIRERRAELTAHLVNNGMLTKGVADKLMDSYMKQRFAVGSKNRDLNKLRAMVKPKSLQGAEYTIRYMGAKGVKKWFSKSDLDNLKGWTVTNVTDAAGNIKLVRPPKPNASGGIGPMESVYVNPKELGDYTEIWTPLETDSAGNVKAIRQRTGEELDRAGLIKRADVTVRDTWKHWHTLMNRGDLFEFINDNPDVGGKKYVVEPKAGMDKPDGYELLPLFDPRTAQKGDIHWGKLGGKYLDRNVYNAIRNAYDLDPILNTLEWIAGKYKYTRTAINPPHQLVSNPLQNITQLYVNGGGVTDVPEATQLWARNDPFVEELRRMGAFSHMFSREELARDKRMQKQAPAVGDGGILDHTNKIAERIAAKIPKNAKDIYKEIQKMVEESVLSPAQALQAVDEIGRLTLAVGMRREGMTAEGIADRMKRDMYNTDAPRGIRYLKSTAVMWAQYPYYWLTNQPRIMMENWMFNLIGLAGATAAARYAASLAFPGEDDEERQTREAAEQASDPDFVRKDFVNSPSPKRLYIPGQKDKKGNPHYLPLQGVDPYEVGAAVANDAVSKALGQGEAKSQPFRGSGPFTGAAKYYSGQHPLKDYQHPVPNRDMSIPPSRRKQENWEMLLEATVPGFYRPAKEISQARGSEDNPRYANSPEIATTRIFAKLQSADFKKAKQYIVRRYAAELKDIVGQARVDAIAEANGKMDPAMFKDLRQDQVDYIKSHLAKMRAAMAPIQRYEVLQREKSEAKK